MAVLALGLSVLLCLFTFGQGGFLPQSRVRGSYGVSNCEAFSGTTGRILACDAFASASGFNPDDVFCVTSWTSCEDVSSRRRSLLALDSRLNVTLNTLLDGVEAEAKAIAGTNNTEGFRSSFRTLAIERNETGRADAIENIDIEDEGAVAETPEDVPGECETEADCDVYYYLKPFCLIPADGDVPFPTECVECLVPPYCPDGKTCGCDGDQICVDFECVPDASPPVMAPI